MDADVIVQRALVTGSILHEGTGLPVQGAVAVTSPNGLVVCNLRSDGAFAVSGYPDRLFPELATRNYTLELLIRAESDQWRAGFFETTVNVAVGMGEDFDPPLTTGTVLLAAEAVHIRGRVTSGADPYPAIAGATVELRENAVVVASTLTGADGRYAFNNVVVLAPVELRCVAATFVTQTKAIAVDYANDVNEHSFRMTPV